ncbi:MAG: hypothetical protein ACE5ID_11130 [Acidobacteriota bacterium]
MRQNEIPPGVQILRPGSWKKPEIRLRNSGEGCVVEKDYRSLCPLLRWYGWLLWRREERAYRILRDVPAVPSLVASRNRVLSMEHINGRAISRLMGTVHGAAVFAGLERAVHELHAAGIYHLDLRKRDNILVAANNSVHLLDFASAVLLRPKGPLRRWIGPLLGFFDRYAVLKWKSALCPVRMSAAEWSRLRWLHLLRLRRTPAQSVPRKKSEP